MATASNPLTGSSWGSANPNQTNNASWINQSINPGAFGQPPGSASSAAPTPPAQLPANFGATNTNPFGMGTVGGGALTSNLAETNLQTGLQKNQLAPIFAQLMTGYGGDAGNFFQKLMNLGSPYYQQQQEASFNQGVQQNQNAAAQARQGLQAQGYGNTPSGAMAAMLGGMNQQGAQSLSNQYLQNLFNNENMQLQGAQGLSSLASMFNPSQLLTSSTNPSIQQPTNMGAQTAAAIGSILGGLFGSGGAKGLSGGGGGG